MTTLPSLRPNGAVSDGSWVPTGAATLWQAIDDDPDTPDDTDYVENSNTTTSTGDDFVVELTDAPSNLSKMDTLSLRARFSVVGYVDDNEASVSAFVTDSAGVAYTNTVTLLNNANRALATSDFSFTLNATGLAATKAGWDGARLVVRRVKNNNMGSDPVVFRFTAVELNGTYTVTVPAGAPTTTLTAGDEYVDVNWTDPASLGSATSIVRREYTTDAGVSWATLPFPFNTGASVGVGGIVRAVAVQSDGKIVIGGAFIEARGTTQNRIARLNTDGTLDTGFNTGGTVGVSGDVYAVAVQSDGKIIIGGLFTTARGTTQNRIARLNTDGTLDTGFNTGGTVGVSSIVNAVAVQSDGKIIIGGRFLEARGTVQNYIARLNTDGTLDTGFNTGGTVGANNHVYAAAIQSDGKIIIGGLFTTARGTTQNYIARLNTDGTLDTGFNTGGTVGVNNDVYAAAIQSDGKIIIGGNFTTARGTTQNFIARLNTDGTLDTGFNTGGTVGVNSIVLAVAIQSDGKILIGGFFTTARGTVQNRIARLNTDGTLEANSPFLFRITETSAP